MIIINAQGIKEGLNVMSRLYLKKNLKIMDATAVSLCKDNGLAIIVFNIRKKGNIKKVVLGMDVGTKIY